MGLERRRSAGDQPGGWLPPSLIRRGLPALWLFVVIVLLGAPAVAAAAPGDLDTTFGTGGVTSLATGTQLYGVAVQSDREVVAVGSSGSSLLVERFSAAGAPEGAFSAGAGVGRAVAVQPDGKIVVAGSDSTGMLVERFNANGTLDGGFGSGGIVHAVAGGSANAVALGPNGTIVAAGQVQGADSFQRIAVLRLSSNGSPDSSLGADGMHLVNLGQDSIAHGVAVQANGAIVIAGSLGPGTHQVTVGFVIRLTSGGAGDGSFGNGGVFVSNPQAGGGAATLNAVALDPAGGVVAAGGSTATNQSAALFVRLTCAGVPDGGFAGSGTQVTPSSSGFDTEPFGANAVTVVAGRRIVGAGRFQDSGVSDADLWGFEPNGSGDFANTKLLGAEASALAVDSTGALVVAGSNIPAGFSPSGFVARYTGFGGPATGTGTCGGSAPAPPTTLAPTATTGPASGVTGTQAQVSGSVNPNGQATTYYFDYGVTTAYGSRTLVTAAGAGTSAVGVSARLSSLKPGTTYHYRLVATNASGVSDGSDATFKTIPTPVFSKISQSNRRWFEKSAHHQRKPLGTTFAFALNEKARVTFAFTQKVTGRKVNGKCVKATSKNRRKRSCKLTVTRATLSFSAKAGKNTRSFQGQVSRSKKLKPGTYKLAITARSGNSLRSKLHSLTFTILG